MFFPLMVTSFLLWALLGPLSFPPAKSKLISALGVVATVQEVVVQQTFVLV